MNFLNKLREERTSLKAIIDGAMDLAATEDRDLSDAEDKNISDAIDRIKAIDERLEQITDIEVRNTAAANLAAKVEGSTGVAKVISEERTYAEHRDASFFADSYASQINNDYKATERIQRHMREVDVENRATGVTGDFGGLVVPQYLTDKVALTLRAGRIAANQVQSLSLPTQGTSFVIPRQLTGATVTSQASELTDVSNTQVDFASNDLTVGVKTIAGSQILSRQSIERGVGFDQLIYNDLAAAYAAQLNTQVLTGAGTSGTHTGIDQALVIDGTNAHKTTATAAASAANAIITYGKIAAAINSVNTNRLMPATHIIMHPRRWAWFCAATDGNSRPLVTVDGAGVNAMGQGNIAGLGYVGTMFGLPVYVDALMATDYATATTWITSSKLVHGSTGDVIIVGKLDDLLLWEDSATPKEVRYEAVNTATANKASLQVQLVAYGYSAFTAKRYENATYNPSVAFVYGSVVPTF